jgi:FkbM family methyltransferase
MNNLQFQSQFGEDKIIYKFFQEKFGSNFIGSVLDIGANDGKTISNSYIFIENGWLGVLIEAAKTPFNMLKSRYENVERVKIHNFALSEKDGIIDFYESFSSDPWSENGLVSSIIESETNYWKNYFGVRYEKYEVSSKTYQSFIDSQYNENEKICWDLISIDIEGADFDILKQIDLTKVECKCLIVEWNKKDKEKFVEYCSFHNMSLLYFNDCNLIFVTNNT